MEEMWEEIHAPLSLQVTISGVYILFQITLQSKNTLSETINQTRNRDCDSLSMKSRSGLFEMWMNPKNNTTLLYDHKRNFCMLNGD